MDKVFDISGSLVSFAISGGSSTGFSTIFGSAVLRTLVDPEKKLPNEACVDVLFKEIAGFLLAA